MGDNQEKKIDGASWTIGNRLKALSVVGSIVISLVSVIVSYSANRVSNQTDQKVESTRVETGGIITNSNYQDFANPWSQWEMPITPRTGFIGLQRNIYFSRKFKYPPHVSASFSLIDTKPPDGILAKFGYPKPDADLAERLRDIHIVSRVDGINEQGFVLQVGIGLPRQSEEFLAKVLSKSQGDNTLLIQDMIKYHQFSDRANLTVSQNELWMLNFYKSIGAIQVSWIAQSAEK